MGSGWSQAWDSSWVSPAVGTGHTKGSKASPSPGQVSFLPRGARSRPPSSQGKQGRTLHPQAFLRIKAHGLIKPNKPLTPLTPPTSKHQLEATTVPGISGGKKEEIKCCFLKIQSKPFSKPLGRVSAQGIHFSS